MPCTKTMSLRLDPALARDLELVARIDGEAQAAVARIALRDHLDRRLDDATVRETLKQMHQSDNDAIGSDRDDPDS